MIAPPVHAPPLHAAVEQRLQLPDRKWLLIRPFDKSEADFRAIVDLDAAIDPDRQHTVAEVKHWERTREPQYLRERFMAEVEGEVVASCEYGHTFWSFHPDRYFVWVGVYPAQQGQGIGGRLWNFMMDRLQKRNPARLISFTREDQTEAVNFLRRRGFEIELRAPLSRINPQTFDPAPFVEKIARVAASGIVIKSLAELQQEDPDWKHKLYELEWAGFKDIPSTDELTPRPFEVFEEQVLNRPSFMPAGWFIALDGTQFVALTMLRPRGEDKTYFGTGLTAVVRSHRRRGIATAIKVRALDYARRQGVTKLDTSNEENNPMFQLNLQLGFRPRPAHLDLGKQIREEEERS